MWCERQWTVYVYARFKPGIRVTEAPFLMVSSLEAYATKLAALTRVYILPFPPQPQPPPSVKFLVWIWTKICILIYVDEIYDLPIWTQHMRQFTGWFIISLVNTLKPRQDGRLFPDDILEWVFLNENLWISNKVS